MISAPRTAYFETTTPWPTKKYDTPEDSLKTRKKPSSSEDRRSSRNEESRRASVALNGDRHRESDRNGERATVESSPEDVRRVEKAVSSSKDRSADSKGKARVTTSSDAEERSSRRSDREKQRYSASKGDVASTIPNQFPGQAPQEYSQPAFSSSGYVGAAADFYGTHDAYLASVAAQPGNRPTTPAGLSAQPRPQATSSQPTPLQEAGSGATFNHSTSQQSFYQNASTSQQSGSSSRPPKQSRPSSSAVAAGVAGVTAASVFADESSSQRPSVPQSSYSSALETNRPPASQSGRPSARPSKQSSSNSNVPLYAAGAAGAAGMTAAAMHHYQHHHPHASTASSGARPSSYTRPPSNATVSNRQDQGTFGSIVDWWRDWEDVRKMEEYTEIIGVCKYCFDHNAPPEAGPRPHVPTRRRSREFDSRSRVNKDSRYSMADEEKRRRRSGGLGAAATAAAGLAAFAGYEAAEAGPSSRRRDDYNDYSVRTDTRRESEERRRRRSLERRSSKRSSRAESEDATRRRSSSRSKLTQSALLGAAVAGGAAVPILNRRPGSASPSSGSASSTEEDAGFFSRLFSPSSKKQTSQRRPRKRRSGGFYRNSNASVDTGLAYGGGASTVSFSRPTKLRRRSSDNIDPTKTLLGLGTATAALAAAQSRRDRGYASSRPGMAASDPRLRHGLPPSSHRLQPRKQDDEDGDWESASDDGNASDASSALAFGGDLPSSPSTESLSSNASGTDKWTWRWGNKKKRRASHERVSIPLKEAAGFAAGAGVAAAGYEAYQKPTRSSQTPSRRVSSHAPMQEVDPVPVSDSRASSGRRRQEPATEPFVTARRSGVELQHPKPVSPPKLLPIAPPPDSKTSRMPGAFGDEEEEIRRKPSTAAGIEDYQPLKRQSTEPLPSGHVRRSEGSSRSQRRRRTSSPTPDVSDRHDGRNAALAGSIAAAGIATGAYALSKRRDSASTSIQKPPVRVDESEDSDEQRAQRQRRRESRRQERQQQPVISEQFRSDRDDDRRQPFPELERTSPPASAIMPNKSIASITPSESASQYVGHYSESESGEDNHPKARVFEPSKPNEGEEPIFDDEIFDPNLFKRPRSDSQDASKVFEDFNKRYEEKTPSMADFFAPRDILSGPAPVDRRADAEISSSDEQSHPRRARSDSHVPKLKVIPATPPHSAAPSRQQSAAPSPLRSSADVEQEPSEDAYTASRVRWGDSEINVYQVESPESFREQEYFPKTDDNAKGPRAVTAPARSQSATTASQVERKPVEKDTAVAGVRPAGRSPHQTQSNSGQDERSTSYQPPYAESVSEASSGNRAVSSQASWPLANVVAEAVEKDRADKADTTSQPPAKSQAEESPRPSPWDYYEGTEEAPQPEFSVVSKKSKKDKKSKRKSVEPQDVEATLSSSAAEGQNDAATTADTNDKVHDKSTNRGFANIVGSAIAAAGATAGIAALSQNTRDQTETKEPSSSHHIPGSFDDDEFDEGVVNTRAESGGSEREKEPMESSREPPEAPFADIAPSKKSKKQKRRESKQAAAAEQEQFAAPEPPVSIVPTESESTPSKKGKKSKTKTRPEPFPFEEDANSIDVDEKRRERVSETAESKVDDNQLEQSFEANGDDQGEDAPRKKEKTSKRGKEKEGQANESRQSDLPSTPSEDDWQSRASKRRAERRSIDDESRPALMKPGMSFAETVDEAMAKNKDKSQSPPRQADDRISDEVSSSRAADVQVLDLRSSALGTKPAAAGGDSKPADYAPLERSTTFDDYTSASAKRNRKSESRRDDYRPSQSEIAVRPSDQESSISQRSTSRRSYVYSPERTPKDLAKGDDYSFKAPPMARSSSDGPTERRSKSNGREKEREKDGDKEKRRSGIFSFLDRRSSEDGKPSRSSPKSSSVGAKDDSVVSDSRKSEKAEKTRKRRSLNDASFDDYGSIAGSAISRRSHSRHDRDDSGSRSRSITGRRRSEDYEAGTSSRAKVNTHSSLRLQDSEDHQALTSTQKPTASSRPADRRKRVSDAMVQEVPELLPLPDSRPDSPTAEPKTTPLSVEIPAPERTPSSTAIPLRFRKPPLSPGLSRESPAQSPVAESPSTPVMRQRMQRPSSTEFKNSNEFRPLYLLERTRKPAEVEDNLPSLPSSHSNSRASSVQGSNEDYFESARQSPSPHRSDLGHTSSDMDVVSAEDSDILGSQQSTPRAGSRSPMHDNSGTAHSHRKSASGQTDLLAAGGLAAAAVLAAKARQASGDTETNDETSTRQPHGDAGPLLNEPGPAETDAKDNATVDDWPAPKSKSQRKKEKKERKASQSRKGSVVDEADSHSSSQTPAKSTPNDKALEDSLASSQQLKTVSKPNDDLADWVSRSEESPENIRRDVGDVELATNESTSRPNRQDPDADPSTQSKDAVEATPKDAWEAPPNSKGKGDITARTDDLKTTAVSGDASEAAAGQSQSSSQQHEPTGVLALSGSKDNEEGSSTKKPHSDHDISQSQTLPDDEPNAGDSWMPTKKSKKDKKKARKAATVTANKDQVTEQTLQDESPAEVSVTKETATPTAMSVAEPHPVSSPVRELEDARPDNEGLALLEVEPAEPNEFTVASREVEAGQDAVVSAGATSTMSKKTPSSRSSSKESQNRKSNQAKSSGWFTSLFSSKGKDDKAVKESQKTPQRSSQAEAVPDEPEQDRSEDGVPNANVFDFQVPAESEGTAAQTLAQEKSGSSQNVELEHEVSGEPNQNRNEMSQSPKAALENQESSRGSQDDNDWSSPTGSKQKKKEKRKSKLRQSLTYEDLDKPESDGLARLDSLSSTTVPGASEDLGAEASRTLQKGHGAPDEQTSDDVISGAHVGGSTTHEEMSAPNVVAPPSESKSQSPSKENTKAHSCEGPAPAVSPSESSSPVVDVLDEDGQHVDHVTLPPGSTPTAKSAFSREDVLPGAFSPAYEDEPNEILSDIDSAAARPSEDDVVQSEMIEQRQTPDEETWSSPSSKSKKKAKKDKKRQAMVAATSIAAAGAAAEVLHEHEKQESPEEASRGSAGPDQVAPSSQPVRGVETMSDQVATVPQANEPSGSAEAINPPEPAEPSTSRDASTVADESQSHSGDLASNQDPAQVRPDGEWVETLAEKSKKSKKDKQKRVSFPNDIESSPTANIVEDVASADLKDAEGHLERADVSSLPSASETVHSTASGLADVVPAFSFDKKIGPESEDNQDAVPAKKKGKKDKKKRVSFQLDDEASPSAAVDSVADETLASGALSHSRESSTPDEQSLVAGTSDERPSVSAISGGDPTLHDEDRQPPLSNKKKAKNAKKKRLSWADDEGDATDRDYPSKDQGEEPQSPSIRDPFPPSEASVSNSNDDQGLIDAEAGIAGFAGTANTDNLAEPESERSTPLKKSKQDKRKLRTSTGLMQDDAEVPDSAQEARQTIQGTEPEPDDLANREQMPPLNATELEPEPTQTSDKSALDDPDDWSSTANKKKSKKSKRKEQKLAALGKQPDDAPTAAEVLAGLGHDRDADSQRSEASVTLRNDNDESALEGLKDGFVEQDIDLAEAGGIASSVIPKEGHHSPQQDRQDSSASEAVLEGVEYVSSAVEKEGQAERTESDAVAKDTSLPGGQESPVLGAWEEEQPDIIHESDARRENALEGVDDATLDAQLALAEEGQSRQDAALDPPGAQPSSSRDVANTHAVPEDDVWDHPTLSKKKSKKDKKKQRILADDGTSVSELPLITTAAAAAATVSREENTAAHSGKDDVSSERLNLSPSAGKGPAPPEDDEWATSSSKKKAKKDKKKQRQSLLNEQEAPLEQSQVPESERSPASFTSDSLRAAEEGRERPESTPEEQIPAEWETSPSTEKSAGKDNQRDESSAAQEAPQGTADIKDQGQLDGGRRSPPEAKIERQDKPSNAEADAALEQRTEPSSSKKKSKKEKKRASIAAEQVEPATETTKSTDETAVPESTVEAVEHAPAAAKSHLSDLDEWATTSSSKKKSKKDKKHASAVQASAEKAVNETEDFGPAEPSAAPDHAASDYFGPQETSQEHGLDPSARDDPNTPEIKEANEDDGFSQAQPKKKGKKNKKKSQAFDWSAADEAPVETVSEKPPSADLSPAKASETNAEKREVVETEAGAEAETEAEAETQAGQQQIRPGLDISATHDEPQAAANESSAQPDRSNLGSWDDEMAELDREADAQTQEKKQEEIVEVPHTSGLADSHDPDTARTELADNRYDASMRSSKNGKGKKTAQTDRYTDVTANELPSAPVNAQAELPEQDQGLQSSEPNSTIEDKPRGSFERIAEGTAAAGVLAGVAVLAHKPAQDEQKPANENDEFAPTSVKKAKKDKKAKRQSRLASDEPQPESDLSSRPAASTERSKDESAESARAEAIPPNQADLHVSETATHEAAGSSKDKGNEASQQLSARQDTADSGARTDPTPLAEAFTAETSSVKIDGAASSRQKQQGEIMDAHQPTETSVADSQGVGDDDFAPVPSKKGKKGKKAKKQSLLSWDQPEPEPELGMPADATMERTSRTPASGDIESGHDAEPDALSLHAKHGEQKLENNASSATLNSAQVSGEKDLASVTRKPSKKEKRKSKRAQDAGAWEDANLQASTGESNEPAVAADETQHQSHAVTADSHSADPNEIFDNHREIASEPTEREELKGEDQHVSGITSKKSKKAAKKQRGMSAADGTGIAEEEKQSQDIGVSKKASTFGDVAFAAMGNATGATRSSETGPVSEPKSDPEHEGKTEAQHALPDTGRFGNVVIDAMSSAGTPTAQLPEDTTSPQTTKKQSFEDIVMQAMDSVGFDANAVSRKTSKERLEEDSGVMDFGPQSGGGRASPRPRGKTGRTSPSSMWQSSTSPPGSRREAHKASPDQHSSAHAAGLGGATAAAAPAARAFASGVAEKQTEGKKAEETRKGRKEQTRKDRDVESKIEEEENVQKEMPGSKKPAKENRSWSWGALDKTSHSGDHESAALVQDSAVTGHDAPPNGSEEQTRDVGVEKSPTSDSLSEQDHRRPAPVEPETKDRSSELFKSPPSNRTSSHSQQSPYSIKESPQTEEGDHGRSISRDLAPIREESPHKREHQDVDLDPADGIQVPRRLRHLLTAQGSGPGADARETHNKTTFAGSPSVRERAAMFAAAPASPSDSRRTAVPTPSNEGRLVEQPPRSYSALSNRSITPGSRAGTPGLRRVDRSVSSDLRSVSKRDAVLTASGDAKMSEASVSPPTDNKPSNYQPLKGIGKDRQQSMSDAGSLVSLSVHASPNLTRSAINTLCQEGWGGAATSSPRSPSRPQSIRKRQSTHILDLERQLEQVMAENKQLAESKGSRGPSEAFYPPNANAAKEELRSREVQLREKDVEINGVKASLVTLQAEVARLTEHNNQLQSANSHLANDTNDRYATLQKEHSEAHERYQNSSRELDALQAKHTQLTSGMEDVVRSEINAALADKDDEIHQLRSELERATERIQSLQRQVASSRRSEEFLNYRDEDYFESACQQLCQHVQQWVLRFSKFSDTRACRLSSQVKDEKIETRLDNAILDGSDVDDYLRDRVRRRDTFMSVVMTMIWEFVFTRYLFGMDRDQRQKLKSLEKTLMEVGPARAVAQWRATTLTLLSRRDVFQEQKAQDTEAVVQEIFSTLNRLLPPPGHLVQQIQESLRNVMRLAVTLSIEMRTQRAEYIMLPPLQPEYDTNGDLARKVFFNADLMNERSGQTSSNQELENQQAVVRIVLFPLVVKKGNDMGETDEEVVVCPAQVLIANPGTDKKVARVMSGPTNASMYSIVPPSAMDHPI